MNYLKASVCIFVLTVLGALPAFAQEEIPPDLVISLNRYACFGWCPVYSLTITADGSVTVIPQYSAMGTRTIVPLKGRVSPEQIRQLLGEFRKIKFYSLRSRYGSAGKGKQWPSCPEYVSDLPTAEIAISEKGKQKTVSHYLGCSGAKVLDDLVALGNKIDEVANTKQWEPQLLNSVPDVIKLELKVNPAKSSKPTKPQ